MDAATKNTCDYLTAVETILNPKQDEDGTYIDISELNHFSIERLRLDLHDLMAGNSAIDSLNATASFGKENIQQVAFGFLEDINRAAKIGLLCGQRVVFWDFLFGRVLRDLTDSTSDRQQLSSVGGELLRFRELAKAGGFVILPHPTSWEEETVRTLGKIPRDLRSSANIGLATTLPVCKDFGLNPYTVFSGNSSEWPEHPELLKNDERYSSEQSWLHRSMDELLSDTKFKFIEGLELHEMYQMMSDRNIREVHKILRDNLLPRNGETTSQYKQSTEIFRNNFRNNIDELNARIEKFALNRAGASISLLTAVGTLLNSVINTEAAHAITSASATALAALFAKFSSENPERDVLVQAFHDMHRKVGV